MKLKLLMVIIKTNLRLFVLLLFTGFTATLFAQATVLYGDGVHDDTKALQVLLDQRTPCVKFPLPEVCYLISSPLEIYSGQELSLDRYCHIKLMPNSNCVMLKNADPENGDNNITVTGGIWDLNNLEQAKNPAHFPEPNPYIVMGFHPEVYNGTVISFYNAKNLKLSDLTVKDPVTYAIVMNRIEYFTIEDITFDFNYGNPWAWNMDGVHLSGNCHFGVIRNLKGSCYDDMVALNADEGVPGPISDIQIDGLFADNCHSAVRLLSADHPVERISISNIYGTYYQYCIGITCYKEWYKGTNGYFDGIVLKNIFASKAPRLPVYHCDGWMIFPFIWFEGGIVVKNISIENVYRKEKSVAAETIRIDKGAVIENFSLNNIVQENLLSERFPLILNIGVIEKFYTNALRSNDGDILIDKGNISYHDHRE